eukprot:9469692-Pyramimonas_sp.AAC.1
MNGVPLLKACPHPARLPSYSSTQQSFRGHGLHSLGQDVCGRDVAPVNMQQATEIMFHRDCTLSNHLFLSFTYPSSGSASPLASSEAAKNRPLCAQARGDAEARSVNAGLAFAHYDRWALQLDTVVVGKIHVVGSRF